MKRRAVAVLKSVATWVLVIAGALAIGKVVQHLRDGEAPPVASVAPEIEGLALAGDAPTLVYFWATWCGVCKVQAPVIESVRTSLDASPSCGTLVKLEETGNDAAFREYGVRLLPTMVVIDAEGRVSKRFLGFTTKWQILRALKSAGGTC
jgi:thioredoxin 1